MLQVAFDKPARARNPAGMKRAVLAILIAVLAVPGQSRSAEPTVYEACAADHARLCPQRSVASDGAIRCLRSHVADVSPSCRRALAARGEITLQRVRHACPNEIAAYCATGEGARHIIRCLRRRENDLSAACRAALPRPIS